MYADLDDLKTLCGDEELIQLTDRADPPSGLIDAAVTAAALTAATHVIDGYVGAQYRLPLSSSVPLLTDLACDIARYRLYKTAATDQVRQRFEDAIKTLVAVSRGLVKLPIADSGGVPGSGSGEPAGRSDVMTVQSEERLFSRTSMRGL